jgi:hypothetical protein
MNMANTFNPAAWLAAFKAADGAYVLAGDHLHLWYISPKVGPDDFTKARALADCLTRDHLYEVAEHLRATALVEA